MQDQHERRSAHGASLRLLIVDDEPMLRSAIRRNLRKTGMEFLEAGSGREALQIVSEETVDVVLTDIRMDDGDGHELLRALEERRPAPAVIVMTAHSSVKDAVQAMREGAYHYMEKPVDIRELERLIPESLAKAGARTLAKPQERDLPILFSDSSPVKKTMELVRRLAELEVPVLVSGESGSGKELVARALHTLSDRAKKPFVAVNCAAIAKDLAESEFFGHRRGAFTGATANRGGRFHEAKGGVLFLDEIGELDLDIQAKFLRVLEDGSYRPVGAQSDSSADARIVAATNRKLESAVAEGRFREDLYYRLSVVPVELPPLRARGKEDLHLLIANFLAATNRNLGTKLLGFSDEVLGLMEQYRWPGNVRELHHFVQQQAVLNDDGMVQVDTLPSRLRTLQSDAPSLVDQPSGSFELMGSDLPDEGVDMQAMLEEAQVHMLKRALERAKGNKSAAAQLLGLKRTTFIERLKKFGLE